MLGNVAPLWETMLAAMKLGAVMIPATAFVPWTPMTARATRARYVETIRSPPG